MRLTDRKEVVELLLEARTSTEEVRESLARRTAVGVAYQAGAQFIANNAGVANTTLEKKLQVLGVGPSSMRVALPRIAKYVAKISAESQTVALEPTVSPSERDYSADALGICQTNEDALRVFIRTSGLLEPVKNAITRRTLAGRWYIGLHMDRQARNLELRGQDMMVADDVLKTFDAPPQNFSLDPGITSRDLRDHDWLVYTDAWTYTKIRRTFPDLAIDKDDLAVLGDLVPIEMSANSQLGNQIYQRYRQYSRSKAALVHTMYVKGDTGRFDQCWTIVEVSRGQDGLLLVDEDGENPFGGDGLPFVALHGHRSGDGPIDLSDFDLLKHDQDLLNILTTNMMRIVRKQSGYQIVVDRNFFKGMGDDEEISQKLTNEVGGIMIGEGNKQRGTNPPTFVQPPPVPPHLMEMQGQHERALEGQAFLSPASFGMVKSHVPDATVQRALDEAGNVFGQRVQDDLKAYETLLGVMLGTVVKCVQRRNPSTLGTLQRHGFGPMEMVQLSNQDGDYPTGQIRLREGAARYRSAAARRADLDGMVVNGLMDGDTFRSILARDLDTPIEESERAAVCYAQKAVADILAGGEYEPVFCSPTISRIIVSEFQQAVMDYRLKRANQQAYRALQAAIVSQIQVGVQYQMAGMVPDPAMQQQQAAPAEPEPSAMDMASPADLLGQSLSTQL